MRLQQAALSLILQQQAELAAQWIISTPSLPDVTLGTFRLVEEMTNVVKAPDSDPVAAPAAAPARPHKLSDLLRQASQLLADMRREGEGAADAIYAILEVMDSDEYAGESQLALVPALTPPGGFGGGGFLPPGALEIPPAPDDGRHFAPSPLEMVEGKVSPLPGDANPIGLAEKVAWMDTKGHAPGRVLADVGEADASASELTGARPSGEAPVMMAATLMHPCSCNRGCPMSSWRSSDFNSSI